MNRLSVWETALDMTSKCKETLKEDSDQYAPGFERMSEFGNLHLKAEISGKLTSFVLFCIVFTMNAKFL